MWPKRNDTKYKRLKIQENETIQNWSSCKLNRSETIHFSGKVATRTWRNVSFDWNVSAIVLFRTALDDHQRHTILVAVSTFDWQVGASKEITQTPKTYFVKCSDMTLVMDYTKHKFDDSPSFCINMKKIQILYLTMRLSNRLTEQSLVL